MSLPVYVSIVLVDEAPTVELEVLAHVLRPHLHWVPVDADTYHALINAPPKNHLVLLDPCQGKPPVDSVESALEAYVNIEQQEREAQAKLQQARPAAKPPKAPRKGLTARQQRELDSLRNELGVNHG